jgi:hypothetical protein
VGGFLKVGHAFLFSLAYIWGLFVIPLMITNNLKLLKPWGTVVGILLTWPLIQALALIMFKGIFLAATSEITASMTEHSNTIEALFYITFSVLNLLILATLIMAPFLAQAFITGSGVAGAILSFGATGVAAGANMYKSVVAPSSTLGRFAKNVYKKSASSTFANTLGTLGTEILKSKTEPASLYEASSVAEGSAAEPSGSEGGSASNSTTVDEVQNNSGKTAKQKDNARRGHFVNKAKQSRA